MSYDELIDMLYMNPESYADQTIKINGEYRGYLDSSADRYTHYILKWDIGGCCPLMVEFNFIDDYSPDDFPKDFEQIEVTGVYRHGRYDDDEFDRKYYYMDVETIRFKER